MSRRNRYRKGEKSTDMRVGIIDGKPSLVANLGGQMHSMPFSADGAGNEYRQTDFGDITVSGTATFNSGASVARITGSGLSIEESSVEVAKFSSTTIIGDVTQNNIEITSSALNIRDGTTDLISLTNSGTGSIVSEVTMNAASITTGSLSTGKIEFQSAARNVYLNNYSNTSDLSSDCVLIGHSTGPDLEAGADNNIAIGTESLFSNTGGAKNVLVGGESGKLIDDGDGTSGYGDENICIGYKAGDDITTGRGNVVIGFTEVATATADNQLVISSGNSGAGGGSVLTWIYGNDSGSIGLGDAATNKNPSNVLHVKNDADAFAVKFENGNGAGHCLDLFASASDDSGSDELLIGRTDAGTMFQVFNDGTVTHTGHANHSDKRIKTDITDATPKLDDINNLKVKNFYLKGVDGNKTGKKRIGFIADEFMEVFPSMVYEVPVKKHGVEYSDCKLIVDSAIVPILVKAVQELSAMLDSIDTRLTNLEAV